MRKDEKVNVEESNESNDAHENAIDRARRRRLLAPLDTNDKRAVNAHTGEEQTGRLREKVNHERVALAEEVAQIAHVQVGVHLDQVVAAARQQGTDVNE